MIAASNGAVAATANRATLVPLPDDDAGPQRRQRLAACLLRRAVDDQHAVEVVELVLDGPRREALELVLDVLAALVLADDPHRDRALDGRQHTLEREAALVVRLHFVASLDELRVHEGEHLVVAAD